MSRTMESGFLLTLKSYSYRMKTSHASRMYRRQDLNVEQPMPRHFIGSSWMWIKTTDAETDGESSSADW
jgi:hypothetical protein